MQPTPPCSAPANSWWTQASGLLLCWELWLDTYSVGCFFFFFFLLQLCCPLIFQNSPQTSQWEGFLVFRNFSSFTSSSPVRVSILNSFVSLFVFYVLFYLPSKRISCLSGCLVSSASIQIVLWKLLSIQVIFGWICAGEKGLPILFLHLLNPPPTRYILR